MVTQYYMCEGFSIYILQLATYVYCYGDHGYHAVIIQLDICLCIYSYVHMCLCVLCMHMCMTIVKLTFVDDLIKQNKSWHRYYVASQPTNIFIMTIQLQRIIATPLLWYICRYVAMHINRYVLQLRMYLQSCTQLPT